MPNVLVAAFSPPLLAQLDQLCAELDTPYQYVDQLDEIDISLHPSLENIDLLITGDLIDTDTLDLATQLNPKHWLALCTHNIDLAASLGRAGADSCVSVDNWPEIEKVVQDLLAAGNVLKQFNRSAPPKLDLVIPKAKPVRRVEPPTGLIGQCDAMLEVYSRIRKVGPTKSTVLIRGETGTGKELIARAIHDSSDRAKKPFVAVNCAAIPETLIESELFGHEKGAFTGAAGKRVGLIEEAEGGTLFLDEIGELPAEAQARLLRFIQESEVRSVGSNKSRKVNVRLIAATHRDLQSQAKSGVFRADLYYRINVFRIFLPLLRERGDDIFEIAQHLLERAALRHKKPNLQLTPDAVEAIRHHSWEGNVRELENTIERAAIMTNDVYIDSADLEIEPPAKSATEPGPQQPHASHFRHGNQSDHGHTDPLTLDEEADKAISSMNRTHSPSHSKMKFSEPKAGASLEEYFQQFVIENQERMNETQLAKMLGISRKCLWERRQRYGIPRKVKDKPKQSKR